LNDPADGRPLLAAQSEDQLFKFFYRNVLSRNPGMPLDEQIRKGRILDTDLKGRGEFFRRGLSESLNEQLNDWRIYSLSKRWDNLSLWAKYAGGHSGYCLEFANVGPFFSSAKEVRYGEPVGIDFTNSEHLDGRWFFCKNAEWSNEEEVRVLIPRGSECMKLIDPSWTTRLILGWKMVQADQGQIRQWAKERSPELKVVSAVYGEVDHVLRIAN
jgi:hypothetical protein